MSIHRLIAGVFAALLLLSAAPRPAAQTSSSYPPSLFAELRWRNIGPMRGGRTKSIVGVPSQPHVFYIGVSNGGVWKTTDAGRTWAPIFDDQPTGSIGDIAVSISNPSIVYVVSGEGLQRPDLSTGDGVYKSTDAGKTWTHLGLRDGQQIPRVIVDPRNPDRLFVAVLGHAYGPNAERGVFRSLDGGRTFEQVLSKDENMGASDLEFDPTNPDIVYASLWQTRQGPWENGAWAGTNGGLFKSADGGTTWKPLTGGLPTGADGVVQADITVAPSNPKRLYASVATMRGTGIWRSDDAGENWMRITADPRPSSRIGGGDLPVPAVHPTDPDTVIMASTVCWKSTDGGRAWTAFRGAPGGDDYQRPWINPTNPDIIGLASDQGAIITLNGGRTWSSWYNQPTAQLYHVAADNAFPYRLCSGQQESGSACVASRGDDGHITFRDWTPVGVEEYGYVAPDPLNPDIVYGGKVTRWDRRTGQVQNISPKPIRTPDYRALRTAPVVFSPIDNKTLYFAANTIFKTIDGGRTWTTISPDLTRRTFELPASIGIYRGQETARPVQRGVVYALAPSPLDINRLWAGTDDGLIHVTVDGGATWKDVTPKGLVPFAKVSIVEASRFEALTAYAAINTIRLDDLRPHIYRTRDGGRTWAEIVGGLPSGATINVIREDPKKKGLLYAGSETTVHVSFDDGDHWQSLRLNMPATSVRDLIVKDDDLVAATHGRGFWILDNVTPLRQMAASVATAGAFLFKPQTALRVRWNMNTDTPLPPDEPTMANPPDGAMVDYIIGAGTSGKVTLDILDAAGTVVRTYASTDPVEPPDPQLAVPPYWVRPPRVLSAAPGMHRFLWDLHYTPAPGLRPNYPIAAVYRNTAPAPTSPWVMPGSYTVKLTAGGRTYTQPLTVKMDPRVRTPLAGLQRQFTLSKQMYDALVTTQTALAELRVLRAKVTDDGLRQKLTAVEGTGGGFGGPPGPPETLNALAGALNQMLTLLQGADATPTAQAVAATAERKKQAAALLATWKRLQAEVGAGRN